MLHPFWYNHPENENPQEANMPISPNERKHLRELAKKYAELSALPIMQERTKLWYDLNDGMPGHPLVSMEFHGNPSGIYPDLLCNDPLASSLESQMVCKMHKHEVFKDDIVIPAAVSVFAHNWIRPFDFTESAHAPKDSNSSAYMYNHVLNDLEEGFHFFKPSVYNVDVDLITWIPHKISVYKLHWLTVCAS